MLEGATFAMRDSLELIREMGVADRPDPRSPAAARRNPLWRQIQADIYGRDVHTLNSTEGPAFGVALLAQVGTGGFASVPEACDATIRTVESHGRRSRGEGSSTTGPMRSTASSTRTCAARSRAIERAGRTRQHRRPVNSAPRACT